MSSNFLFINRAYLFQLFDRFGNVGFDNLSVAVKACAEGIDNFFLGGVLFQTIRYDSEGFVALNQAVKICACGGDDYRLTVHVVMNKCIIQFHIKILINSAAVLSEAPKTAAQSGFNHLFD
jgi:hypothetical protein